MEPGSVSTSIITYPAEPTRSVLFLDKACSLSTQLESGDLRNFDTLSSRLERTNRIEFLERGNLFVKQVGNYVVSNSRSKSCLKKGVFDSISRR